MTRVVEPLPGSPAHQALLRRIIDAYATDARVLAIGVLGSIARGTWDAWSDLDLDIVVTAQVDALAEGRRLGGADALVLSTRPGEIDVVLSSLEEFSIRFHTLGTTNAHIVDDLRILAGTLDRTQIVAAGLVVSRPPRPLELIASEAVRLALGVWIRCRRRALWQGAALLDELRACLLELFATARGEPRGSVAFDALADADLQARLHPLLARADLGSLRLGLEGALELLDDVHALTDGVFELTPQQRNVLAALRRQMADAD